MRFEEDVKTKQIEVSGEAAMFIKKVYWGLK